MASIKKYWIWGIFISILGIFAMSHNANAIDFIVNYDNYELYSVYYRPSITMDYNANTTSCQSVVSCAPLTATGESFIRVYSLQTGRNDITLKKNQFIEMTVFIGGQTPNRYLQDDYPLIQQNFTTNNNNLEYIGFKVLDQNTYMDLNSSMGYGSSSGETYTSLIEKYTTVKLYNFYFKVKNDYTGRIGFQSSNYNNTSTSLFTYFSFTDTPTEAFRILNINIFNFIGSEENREVEEKTQEAVDESQAAGGSSSSSAQTGTTGLLNAITGAVSVISSASPTNCKINGNMGNLDMGQLDLCANPAPAFVQTIGSLILILMCVPLAISLFNRFIAIFRSFQS